jgi:cell division protein FtsB
MKKWFLKLSLKMKLFFGIIITILVVFLYFLIHGKVDVQKILKYELKKAEAQREIEYLNQVSEENTDKIKEIEKKRNGIKKKIEEIEAEESSKSVSLTEIDKFFKERGF